MPETLKNRNKMNSDSKEIRISQKTLLPISLIISIVGGAIWLTVLFSDMKNEINALNIWKDQHMRDARTRTEGMRELNNDILANREILVEIRHINSRLQKIESKVGL